MLDTNTHGGSGIYLHSFLQHGTKWTSVVNFIPHLHYPWGQGRVFCTNWIGGHWALGLEGTPWRMAVMRTKPQFLRRPACILFTIMTTLFCLLSVQELHVLYTHVCSANRTKCPALLLLTPASEYCPWSVQSTSYHQSLFLQSSAVLWSLSLHLHCLNLFSPHMSYMSLCTNHNVPHLVSFYTTPRICCIKS